MGYFDWHDKPGYWGDYTRLFDSDAKLLDDGCGRGWLADHFDNYTGIDGAVEAVDEARSLGRNVILGSVEEPLPFDDNSFGAIVMKDLLEHVPDPAHVVRECSRVAMPESKIFASVPDAQRWVWDDYTHRRPFTRKALRLLFEDQGLEVKKCGYEAVTPGISIVSGMTRRKRRPRIFTLLAALRLTRRNVYVLAQTSSTQNESQSVPDESLGSCDA